MKCAQPANFILSNATTSARAVVAPAVIEPSATRHLTERSRKPFLEEGDSSLVIRLRVVAWEWSRADSSTSRDCVRS